jgi:hypothetical protein
MKIRAVPLRFLFAFLAAGLLASCASAQKAPGDAVEIEKVLANPTAYTGHTITIKGWVSLRAEDYGLWATKSDYEKGDMQKCISILNKHDDEKTNRAFDRTYALVTGVIVPDSYHDAEGRFIVRLNACNKVGMRFEKPSGMRASGE